MTLKIAALAKLNQRTNFLWLNIMYGVKIHDIKLILCFSLTLNQF